MQTLHQIFLLSLLAGVLGLDATAMLQTLVSRPLVAGGLAGWALGDIGSGLATGSLVELLWMGGVPVGSLVPPDGTLAAIFAAAAGVLLPRWVPNVDPFAAASLGLLAAVPVGSMGSRAEIVQRRLTDRLSRYAEASVSAQHWQGLAWAMAGGLALAFLRSVLAALLVLGLGLPALAELLQHLPADAMTALRWGYWLGWLLGLAVAADYFWERRSLKYLGLALVSVAVIGSRPGVSREQVLAFALGLSFVAGLWRWRRAWLA
jgi:mannose/fructose/N-acetylgalactosamine-specific phosphotransferase system component IIC